jgi:hypothetical protein
MLGSLCDFRAVVSQLPGLQRFRRNILGAYRESPVPASKSKTIARHFTITTSGWSRLQRSVTRRWNFCFAESYLQPNKKLGVIFAQIGIGLSNFSSWLFFNMDSVRCSAWPGMGNPLARVTDFEGTAAKVRLHQKC